MFNKDTHAVSACAGGWTWLYLPLKCFPKTVKSRQALFAAGGDSDRSLGLNALCLHNLSSVYKQLMIQAQPYQPLDC